MYTITHKGTSVHNVLQCTCTYICVRTFLESEHILAGPHFFIGAASGLRLEVLGFFPIHTTFSIIAVSPELSTVLQGLQLEVVQFSLGWISWHERPNWSRLIQNKAISDIFKERLSLPFSFHTCTTQRGFLYSDGFTTVTHSGQDTGEGWSSRHKQDVTYWFSRVIVYSTYTLASALITANSWHLCLCLLRVWHPQILNRLIKPM